MKRIGGGEMRFREWIYNNSGIIVFNCLAIGIGIIIGYFGGALK
jgi:hypothetical protein